MPYIHGVSHNLKRVATKFQVDVVFSALCKLSRVCALTSERIAHKDGCNTKHYNQFVPCSTGVVYHIPLSCGKVYIGQTGRCLNDRLREHGAFLNSASGAHLALHCKECGCKPNFGATEIKGRNKDKLTREISEAAQISYSGSDKCVSAPSISLLDRELGFLFTSQFHRSSLARARHRPQFPRYPARVHHRP